MASAYYRVERRRARALLSAERVIRRELLVYGMYMYMYVEIGGIADYAYSNSEYYANN